MKFSYVMLHGILLLYCLIVLLLLPAIGKVMKQLV